MSQTLLKEYIHFNMNIDDQILPKPNDLSCPHEFFSSIFLTSILKSFETLYFTPAANEMYLFSISWVRKEQHLSNNIFHWVHWWTNPCTSRVRCSPKLHPYLWILAGGEEKNEESEWEMRPRGGRRGSTGHLLYSGRPSLSISGETGS